MWTKILTTNFRIILGPRICWGRSIRGASEVKLYIFIIISYLSRTDWWRCRWQTPYLFQDLFYYILYWKYIYIYAYMSAFGMCVSCHIIFKWNVCMAYRIVIVIIRLPIQNSHNEYWSNIFSKERARKEFDSSLIYWKINLHSIIFLRLWRRNESLKVSSQFLFFFVLFLVLCLYFIFSFSRSV